MTKIGRIPDGPGGPGPTETKDELPGPPKLEMDFEAWLMENIPEHENPHLIPARRLRELLRKYKKVFNERPHELPRDRNIKHTIRLQEEAYAPYRRLTNEPDGSGTMRRVRGRPA